MVDRKVDLMEDRWEGPMEGRLVDLKVGLRADHLEDLKVGLRVDHLEDLRGDHSADPMEDLREDHLEVQKGRVVTKVGSLLSERLGVFEPVQVVQLVVMEEMEQARIVPV